MSNRLKLLFTILIVGGALTSFYAQESDSIEIYLIDAYVKPELPHKITLSFFTSDLCKSKVIIDDNYEYTVNMNSATCIKWRSR